jgi:hypothetical protein
MIVMAVIAGVIAAGLGWAGAHDYRRRRSGAGLSVAEGFKRQREIDRQGVSERGDPGGGGGA